MTTVRKVLGRLPMLIGDWDSNYREGQGYLKNNRVLIFNSELQSKIDNNTYAPATQNAQTGVITFDTTHWTVISDGRETIGLGTASKKDVPSSGNDASTTQVVMGDDSRLSDARKANGGNSATVNGHTVYSDVPEKAKFTDSHYYGSVTATSGYALTKVQVDSNGTWSKEDAPIPTKNDFTGSIESGNTGFVTGGDAYTALTGKADLVNGVVPADQLPSFVDDIVELLKMDSTAPATCSKGDYYYNTSTKKIVRATGTNTWGTEATTNTDPEKSKIYFDKNEQKSYRWSGSAMLEIHDTLSIGTSAGTAADGKVVYDHVTSKNNPHNVTVAQIGAVSTEANQGLTDTEKSNARANIGLGNVANTGDSATPVKNGTTKFTTGGAYTELDKKVDKVTGKGLSTNDYDDTAKGKVDNIPSSPKYTDTTYQFEQSGNTLKMGTNNGTKSDIYTPSVPSVASTSSLLKGDGSGNAVAATAGTDYQAPLSFKTTPSSSNKVVTESDSMAMEIYLGNIDVLATAGSYRLDANQAGTYPTGAGANYAQLLVVHGAGDTYAQLYFPYGNSEVYVRTAYSVESTFYWHDWVKLTTTSDIPLSLPANGGNADTVDGYHYNNLPYLSSSGGTLNGTLTVNAGNCKFGPSLNDNTYKYHHSLYLGDHGDDYMKFYENEFQFWANGGSSKPTVKIGEDTVIDTGNISSHIPSSLPANGGNADTVDGYHYNNLPYLPTSGGTITGYLNILGGDNLTLRASSSHPDDPGDLIFGNYSDEELMRIFYADNQACIRFGPNDYLKVMLHSGNWSNYITIPSTLPASDVYPWAKASTKPSYTASEVGISSGVQAITSNTSSSCSITGSSNDGKSQTIIYTNSTSSDLTVIVPTDYTTPDGQAIELTCKAGGYCEVNYLNIGGTIYARGL